MDSFDILSVAFRGDGCEETANLILQLQLEDIERIVTTRTMPDQEQEDATLAALFLRQNYCRCQRLLWLIAKWQQASQQPFGQTRL